MLELKSIDAGYGTFQALFGVTLDVKAGEAVGVIGPNGAGKTTLMRVISGLIRPTRRHHHHGGRRRRWRRRRIASSSLGIAHVPENRRLFPAPDGRGQSEHGRLHARGAGAASPSGWTFVFDLFPRMKERRHQLAGTMSGGEQQMCAIGRALMSRSQAAAARRAVGGPGAGRRAAGVRTGEAHPRRRPHRADRRAERAAGAEGGRSRLPAGGRLDPRLRHVGRDAGRATPSAKPISECR